MKALAVSLHPLAVGIIPLERKAQHRRAVRKKQHLLEGTVTVCHMLEWPGNGYR